MSFKKKLLKNIVVTGGYSYVAQLVIFLSTIITSRLLSPSSFGYLGLISVFTGFISVFSDSGISLAVIKSKYKRTYHKAVDALALLIGITLCITTCLLSIPMAEFYNNKGIIIPTIVMSMIFVFKSMTIVRCAILTKDLQFKIIGKAIFFSSVLQVLFTVIIAYIGGDYWALIIPQLISAIFLLTYYESKVHLGYEIYSIAHMLIAYKLVKRTVGPFVGFNIFNYWARNLDNLIVGKVYGVVELGIYTRGYMLLTAPLNLIISLIGSVLYPSLNRLKDEGGDINEEYFSVLKLITMISFPISSLMILFPEDIVLFLWGNEWINVSKLLPYFGLLIIGQSLLSTAGHILVLAGKERELMISGCVGALIMIGGIIYGSLYSIISIVQFYSLAYIAVILPFNLVYVYISVLDLNKNKVKRFWLPIIFFSLTIWSSCFYKLDNIKICSILTLMLFIVIMNKNIFKVLIRKVYNKKQIVKIG